MGRASSTRSPAIPRRARGVLATRVVAGSPQNGRVAVDYKRSFTYAATPFLNRSEELGRLENRVALVAGATRGAGRGIAIALGEEGATVYCTGRSIRGQLAS